MADIIHFVSRKMSRYILGSFGGIYLSLDDVEEEIWVAAAAEEMSETQRLIEAFYLLLDLRRRTTRRTPEQKQ